MNSIKIIVNDDLDHIMKIGYWDDYLFVMHNINNLPSYIDRQGSVISWRVHNKLHRTNGPAVIFNYDNKKDYFLDNNLYTEEAYWKKINEDNNK